MKASSRLRPRDFALIGLLAILGITLAVMVSWLISKSEDDLSVQTFGSEFGGELRRFQDYVAVRLLGLRAVADAMSTHPSPVDLVTTQRVCTAQAPVLCC